MQKNNRKCIVCGKEYHFCPSCAEGRSTPWKTIYHDDNCRQIYHVVSWYLANDIKKDEAIESLKKCDLSKKYVFNNDIRKTIDNIFANEKKDESVVSFKNTKKELLRDNSQK